MWLDYIIISVVTSLLVGFSGNILVTLPNGKICGRVAKTTKNTLFYAFQEVPYAAPPIGNLRFKAPIPVKDWCGILDTTKNTKICTQVGINPLENEDCLYLNVYTPVIPGTEANLPVLVFLHGGGFVGGSGIYDNFGPEFFMDTGKLLVVTINYRLGPFGFLSTEDDVIPGNYGLKDQRFAFQWIQDNIHLFGGDPSKVTINGQSAGSASVSYHVLSKQSRGLFRGAILESGTVLSSWSYQRYARDIAYKAAAAVDRSFKKSNTSEELLELLQKISASELQRISERITAPTTHINPGFSFAPVVESGDDGVLTELAYEAVEKGRFNKVTMIVGINSEESIEQVSDLDRTCSYQYIDIEFDGYSSNSEGDLHKRVFHKHNELEREYGFVARLQPLQSLSLTRCSYGTLFETLMTGYDNDLANIVNDDFHIEDERTQLRVGRKIRRAYTKGFFQDDLASSVRFISDCEFTYNIIKYAKLVSQFADVYFYQFSYDGKLGNVDDHIEGAESVAHGEELIYLWRNSSNKDLGKFPENDVITHKRMVKMWTNFVTNMNPTFEKDDLLQNIIWPPVACDDFHYLDIREDLTVKTDPKGDTFKSWDRIYGKYGVRPFDTL